ncbi:MAG: 4-hydroxy-3-methylbut-2-en-1-yl diphosphate synthase [Gammaproteobacteria bacterium]|nr:4-hydroxy-3-methylbut-2-en-1-yl diphosphate synthase [Gammaproteobacteria bacterium]MAY03097.1 4-hydroxy-3-methylbut-2-en-1-yl diphosphate synthase [Gammaproteobacteria bacterium]|tara:strand:+ start:418703 stop:419833 length:1131 start_codon:yes stop_codon:yes gene_type:complete
MNTESPITRRKSRQIMVGNVPVGGDAPIAVQSMTNTDTCDVDATVEQIRTLEKVGVDIVRVSVPTMAAADAFKAIRAEVQVPVIADIHFDYKIALKVLESGVDCLRINPGNIGREERVRAVIESAKDKNVPLRIGVNAGSLGKELLRKYKEPNADALVESALRQIDILDSYDFQDFKVSMKASEIFMTVEAYRKLAPQIEQPLHLGITEAGGLRSGTVKSSIGLGLLLMDGIGDTIRISLAADPVEEVRVGFDILKSLNLRKKGVNLVACPSCSRQNFDVIATVNELESRLEDITTPVHVSVVGCIVNGPGEAKIADVGLTGATPVNMSYINGKTSHKISNVNLVDELEAMVRAKVADIEAESESDNPAQKKTGTD